MKIASPMRYLALTMAVLVGSATAYDDTLTTNEQLYAYKHPMYLKSGEYKFGLTDKGDLYLKGNCGTDIIAHGGSKNTVVKMQSDGNVVLYNIDNIKHPVAKWSTNTQGNHEAKLKLYYGYVAVISRKGDTLWKYTLKCKKPSPPPPPPPPPKKECKEYVCKGAYLRTNEILKKGEYLCADGMKFGLTCDGEWVYVEHGRVKHYGSISNKHLYADIKMQSDGNLVLYELDGHKITDQCSTQTSRYHEAYLKLSHDGPQIKQGGHVVWDTYPVHCRH